jgi:hypothetical protein
LEEDADSIFTVNPDSTLKMKLERKWVFFSFSRTMGGLKIIDVINRGVRDLYVLLAEYY